MQEYKAVYINQNFKIQTIIKNYANENTFPPLRLKIGNIEFEGNSFDDFCPTTNPINYQIEYPFFSFNKIPVYNSDKFHYQLCNCILEVTIPLIIVSKDDAKIVKPNLRFRLTLGSPQQNGGLDFYYANFVLRYGKKVYFANADCFESALIKLNEQLPEYCFHNCFGCQYGDYHPAGNGFFGDMLCFRQHKEKYNQSKSKQDIFDIIDLGVLCVQETWCCSDYQIRKPNTGYRG